MANLIPSSRRRNQPIDRRRNPLEQLRQEFDSLFENFMGGSLAPMWGEDGGRQPWGLNVSTKENEMVVKADLPGWEPSDLDIQIRGDVLTIRGEKKQQAENDGEWGAFEESLSVPPGVEADKVKATYRNGVLELHMPLPETARPQRIAIQADSPASEKTKAGAAQKAPHAESAKEQSAGTTSSSKKE